MLTLVLVLVLVLHALFALVLWYEMQPKLPQLAVAPVDSESEQALVIRLIDHSSEPRVAPPPEPPSPPTLVPPRQVATPRVRPVTHEKPRSDAMVVQDHAAAPAPAASVATPSASSVFAKDGSVRLAPEAPTNYATTNAKGAPPKPADDRQIMQHDYNQMHTKTTRFEKYFPPPNETVGGAVGRHVGDVIKGIAESICDPKKPGFNPLCGTPPIPPSPKDGDERLNMPSRSLADDPNPPKPPPLSTCFAEYREIKPLSYGCPINTPDLAFKADVRECIDLYRAGRYLKPYCPADTPKRAAAEASAPAASASVGSH
ncbi:hypothetical protein [Rhodanobacter sp. A1T4]|uniref:hypothetical protein n=1 Tax=Rhodanobacter sp. A1T4 TaxID=2723087 RepID=UPI0017A3C2EE|nr:hypothetical protein [Rhodanobacter sp. A1T4]